MPDKGPVEQETEIAEEEEMESAEQVEVVEEAEGVEEKAEPEEPSEVERLQKELEEARAEAEEYLDGWRRAQAEFANYKKRQRAEQAKLRELANAGLLRKLLPVLDDFDRAIATMPEGVQKLSWSQGLLMVRRKLEAILESEGVEPIETEGEAFDPYYHEAVTHEEVEGYEEGEVIGEVQKGYVLGDRVLRPALVRVAKAPSVAPKEEEEKDVGGEESGVGDG
jgi:molecular chaperone GrpE